MILQLLAFNFQSLLNYERFSPGGGGKNPRYRRPMYEKCYRRTVNNTSATKGRGLFIKKNFKSEKRPL